jgi:hypothetical protein
MSLVKGDVLQQSAGLRNGFLFGFDEHPAIRFGIGSHSSHDQCGAFMRSVLSDATTR